MTGEGRTRTPTYVYRYEVTASDYAPVAVGSLLADKRREHVKDWTILDTATGLSSTFVGERRERLCSACFSEHRLSNLHEHDGACGVLHDQPASDDASGQTP